MSNQVFDYFGYFMDIQQKKNMCMGLKYSLSVLIYLTSRPFSVCLCTQCTEDPGFTRYVI